MINKIRDYQVRNIQELRRSSLNRNSIMDFSSQFHILKNCWKGVRMPFPDRTSISNTWGRIDIMNYMFKMYICIQNLLAPLFGTAYIKESKIYFV